MESEIQPPSSSPILSFYSKTPKASLVTNRLRPAESIEERVLAVYRSGRSLARKPGEENQVLGVIGETVQGHGECTAGYRVAHFKIILAAPHLSHVSPSRHDVVAEGIVHPLAPIRGLKHGCLVFPQPGKFQGHCRWPLRTSGC